MMIANSNGLVNTGGMDARRKEAKETGEGKKERQERKKERNEDKDKDKEIEKWKKRKGERIGRKEWREKKDTKKWR